MCVVACEVKWHACSRTVYFISLICRYLYLITSCFSDYSYYQKQHTHTHTQSHTLYRVQNLKSPFSYQAFGPSSHSQPHKVVVRGKYGRKIKYVHPLEPLGGRVGSIFNKCSLFSADIRNGLAKMKHFIVPQMFLICRINDLMQVLLLI